MRPSSPPPAAACRAAESRLTTRGQRQRQGRVARFGRARRVDDGPPAVHAHREEEHPQRPARAGSRWRRRSRAGRPAGDCGPPPRRWPPPRSPDRTRWRTAGRRRRRSSRWAAARACKLAQLERRRHHADEHQQLGHRQHGDDQLEHRRLPNPPGVERGEDQVGDDGDRARVEPARTAGPGRRRWPWRWPAARTRTRRSGPGPPGIPRTGPAPRVQ